RLRASGSKRPTRTGPRVTDCKAARVTKRSACRVRITETCAPSRPSARTRSGVLYAAIPPVIPRRMRAPARDRAWVMESGSSRNLLLLGLRVELGLGLILTFLVLIEDVAFECLLERDVRHLAPEVQARLP